jgi:putative ABC transport system permease protein
MPILLRIALRNLIEHKGKTLIIGTLVALGVVVLIVGNSLMDTAREGISRAFVDNYTGEVMISGTAEGPISLFGVQSVGGIDPTPVLPDYPEIVDVVRDHQHISGWTTQITGFGLLRPEDERIDGFENSVLTVLFGSEPESYHELFDNVRIVEGRYLEPGEQGLMLSTDRVEELEENAVEALQEADIETDAYPVSVGDEVRIVGLTSDGLPSIRVVPIIGIYEMTGISEGVGFELVSYVDPQTLRAILRLNLGRSADVVLDESQTELLDRTGEADMVSEDDLFSGDLFGEPPTDDADPGADDDFFFESLDELAGAAAGDGGTAQDGASAGDARTADPAGEDDTVAPPPDTAAIDQRLASQTWHYILARVDNPRRVASTISELNEFFDEAGIDAQAGNWEVAAGPFATTADVIRTVFNVAIIVIGIVAVIIMMNTLVISVMERTSEIGTMRALGAQRRFVWKMFMYEILAITTVFGIIGSAAALGIIGILHIIGIPATNTFLTVLFAGPELKPVASAVSMFGGLIIVSIIGLVAHIYPVSVALRIQPIRAIQTE